VSAVSTGRRAAAPPGHADPRGEREEGRRRYKIVFAPVLRVHDFLVCIRIRIRGSIPLTNGSGFFKDKKLKKSHKTVGIKVFLTILCMMMKDPDPDPEPDPDPYL
jgi:hypothetical protein